MQMQNSLLANIKTMIKVLFDFIKHFQIKDIKALPF